MDFSDPPRRARGESIVPMINVVFLLLIFFLMTSTLTGPEPFEVTPPETADAQSAGGEDDGQQVVFMDENGRIHHDGQEGDSAIDSLAAADHATVKMRADADLEASVLAETLQRMAQAGLSSVELVVTPE